MNFTESTRPRLNASWFIVPHSPDLIDIRSGVWSATSFTLEDDQKRGILGPISVRINGEHTIGAIAKSVDCSLDTVLELIDQLSSLGAIGVGPTSLLEYGLEGFVATGGQPTTKQKILWLGDKDLIDAALSCLEDLKFENVFYSDLEPGQQEVLHQRSTEWALDGLESATTLGTFDALDIDLSICLLSSADPIFLSNLNRVFLYLSKPWLISILDGPFIHVGPLFIPRQTACFRCFESRLLMNLQDSEGYLRLKRLLAMTGQSKSASLAAKTISRLQAAHVSFEIANYILLGKSILAGKVQSMHIPTSEINFNNVHALPGCPACGSQAGLDDQALYFDFLNVTRPAD